MGFCIKCGHALAEGAHFCGNCGVAIGEAHTESEQRKTVYDGELHKCPNCGELTNSFKSHCSLCGYEFRNLGYISSAKELAVKLEEIQSQKMPHIEEKKSFIKSVFGRDFKDVDEVAVAQSRFDEQKKEQKYNLIVNFPVPNTKEDLLEFMILISSNIDSKKELDDLETKAWISKLEQVYEKANLVMGDTPHFSEINDIYTHKKRQLKIRKFKSRLFIYFLFGIYFIFIYAMLLQEYPIVMISITIVGFVVTILGFKLYNKYLKE